MEPSKGRQQERPGASGVARVMGLNPALCICICILLCLCLFLFLYLYNYSYSYAYALLAHHPLALAPSAFVRPVGSTQSRVNPIPRVNPRR